MAAREKVADKNVATTELAAVLGISARRVQQLAQDGILDTVERGKFELGAAVQAYIRFLGRDAMTEEDKKLESAKRKAEATLKLSKAKIAKAQADELSGQMPPSWYCSASVCCRTRPPICALRRVTSAGSATSMPSALSIRAATGTTLPMAWLRSAATTRGRIRGRPLASAPLLQNCPLRNCALETAR